MPEDKQPKPGAEAVEGAMREIGLSPAGGRQKLPADRVFELFQTALQQGLAQKKPAPPPAEAAEAPPEAKPARPPRKPSEFERKVQQSMRDAFDDYVNEKVAADLPPGTEVSVDAKFIQQHGSGMLNAVLQAFVKSVVPEQLQVDVPTKKADGEADAQVKLKVDVGKLVNDVVSGARAQASQESAPEAPPDETKG